MNLNNLGWILSNDEQDKVEIQKDDEMGRFKTDEEATIFVCDSYMELLSACETALDQLEYGGMRNDDVIDELTRVIERAKKNE